MKIRNSDDALRSLCADPNLGRFSWQYGWSSIGGISFLERGGCWISLFLILHIWGLTRGCDEKYILSDQKNVYIFLIPKYYQILGKLQFLCIPKIVSKIYTVWSMVKIAVFGGRFFPLTSILRFVEPMLKWRNFHAWTQSGLIKNSPIRNTVEILGFLWND